MNWKEIINLDDEKLDLLSEIEKKRMSNLEKNYREAPTSLDKLAVEKEILTLYLQAIERNKQKKKTLGEWLNEEELHQIDLLRGIITESDRPYYYEALIYQVYVDSICRQTHFSKEEQVRQMIEEMKNTNSDEEADELAKTILSLLREV
ncbi:hypothetical protein [Ornithinibacillus halotolerans]|uniref:Uncharacterized protein n=1 Tax=Ornithinibacillus halotolerans TaxID=1274357 RepID=A0A916S0Y7_9BACI|nr:hypothetical protein [Ornithinibacillus halotolerans]GGA79191.1 hypothetical protein GCM10008025_23280 [Ornithinibacillus halotolerans]